MTKLTLIKSDITKLKVDAIVNAANRTLLGGEGVDGAIHLAAGPELLEECKYLGGCKTGDAKITSGYNLPAKHVIHTVGPVYGEESEDESMLLAKCYRRCLEVAVQNKIKTIAFPCISTGFFDFPSKEAAVIAINTVKKFIEENPDALDEIIFCTYGEKNYEIYQKILNKIE